MNKVLLRFGEFMSFLARLDSILEKFLQWLWRNRKALGAALAVLVAAYAVGSLGSEPTPRGVLVAEASELQETAAGAIFERLWIDHLPKGQKDGFRAYFFLKRHPVGVHLLFHSATYRTQEFFQHEVKGKKVTFLFPDPGVKATAKVSFQNVSGDHHFDMKMTLDRDPQTKGAEYSYYRLKKAAASSVLAGFGISEASLMAVLESR